MRNTYLFNPNENGTVIFEGRYEGRNFEILTGTGHPCAGIAFPEGEDIESVELIPVDVHGGFTILYRVNGELFVGWDYGHAGDFNSLRPDGGGEKFDLMTIIAEVIRVIDDLNAAAYE